MKTIDPEWTKKVDTGEIVDPLHFDRIRNRILRDLLFSVNSIGISQRLRYISFSLWCLDNIENPKKDDIIPLEKIFLLSNIIHNHKKTKDRGTTGLSGKNNILWNKKTLMDPSNPPFSISEDTFEIQKNGSGFSQYYKSIMDKLLLIKEDLSPSPLGKQIATEYNKKQNIKFKELQNAAKKQKITTQQLKKFSKTSCCCLLDGKEEQLLRKIYFGQINKTTNYKDLKYTKTDTNKKQKLDLNKTIDEKDIFEILDTEKTADIDEYLKRYFKSELHIKTQKSFLLYLWITNQLTQKNNKSAITEIDQLKQIRELWRLQIYYDYIDYASESLFTAILHQLKTKPQNEIYPEQLIKKITSNPKYKQTIHTTLNNIKTEKQDEDIGWLQKTFQYIYYGKPQNKKPQINKTTTKFHGNWNTLLETIETKIDPQKFYIDDSITEWKLKTLIEKEITKINTQPQNRNIPSKIFGYTTVLLAILRLRHQKYFSKDELQKYWRWIAKFEKEPPGPTSIIKSIDNLSGKETVENFISEFTKKWCIEQHQKAAYEKMETNRMPRLYVRDHTGRISHQNYRQNIWTPTITYTKFKRMTDILYDLGLINSPKIQNTEISQEGKKWLDMFLEVES